MDRLAEVVDELAGVELSGRPAELMGAELVELRRQLERLEGSLVVVDPAELDDDLVRDVTEILTSLCARLYGRRSAANRAAKAVAALETAP